MSPESIDLSAIPVDDLQKEILRRREEERDSIRSEIADHEAAIRKLKAKLGEAVEPVAKRSRVVVPAAEREVKILRAFDSAVGSLPAGVIAQKTGIRGSVLTNTLSGLVTAGKLVRSGSRRSTVYSSVESPAQEGQPAAPEGDAAAAA